MLKHLHLKNFMGLADIALDPVKRSGQKYSVQGGLRPVLSRHPNWEAKTLEDELTRKFIRLFLPQDARLSNMHHTGAKCVASLTARFANDQEITAFFTEKSDNLEIKYSDDLRTLYGYPVFIPGNEVLYFMI